MKEKILEIIANEDDDNKRLDVFLANHIEEISRSRAKELIENGFVHVNDTIKYEPSFKLRKNFKVKIRIPEPEPCSITPINIPLDIKYEDNYIIVINKPANMVVHPGAGKENNTLVHALLAHCKDLSGIGGVERPGIVHRLDKDTTGLIIVAKDDITHRELSKGFKERKIKKTYYAIVSGEMRENSGIINKGIKRDPIHRKKMCVSDLNSREAITHWSVIKRLKKSAFLEVDIKTGRTHQIRVHLSSIGHPILGDVLYGGKSKININGNHISIPRYMLHSGKLEFRHPHTQQEMTLTADLPNDMKSLIDILSYETKS